MIITPDVDEQGTVAALLLAAADTPSQVRTVSTDRGLGFEVPDEVAAKAGLLAAPDAAKSQKPKRAPRKTAPKTATSAGEADTNQ
ncbi:MAG: hypothetical protein QM658_03125 [Gordonia sp. (in: high G+C Gram-positive bacteria)]